LTLPPHARYGNWYPLQVVVVGMENNAEADVF
jgi:hypothetical protein